LAANRFPNRQENIKAVLGNLPPSIRLVPQQPVAGQEEGVGGCRIGGTPDSPQGVEWPRLSTDARSDTETFVTVECA
jgi:hypothetical protein